MKKIEQLPFMGSYGFESEHQFRYFFLRENGKDLDAYKNDILKCLKYDVLYSIFPDHKSGHETIDSLRPSVTKPVKLDDNTVGYVFHESVQGNHEGEIVATCKVSEDGKSLDLTLYDRNTTLALVSEVVDGVNNDPEYTLVDKIVESNIKITKGKKISSRDITVYHGSHKAFGNEPEHSYEAAMNVIKEVKSKLPYKCPEPTDLLEDSQEKTQVQTTARSSR